MQLTNERLEEIRGRERAATPGEWRTGAPHFRCHTDHGLPGGGHGNGRQCRYTFDGWIDDGSSVSRDIGYGPNDISREDTEICGWFSDEEGGVRTPQDAQFIAHARQDIPALLTENTALNKALLAKIVECQLLQQRVTELREQNVELERERDELKTRAEELEAHAEALSEYA